MKKALVCGAGGFIGSHLVKRLKSEGYWVRGVDLKLPEFSPTTADDFILADLRILENCEKSLDQYFDEVYQLAADMGGAGYIFTGVHDLEVMYNVQININFSKLHNYYGKLFYSSSACVYPQEIQSSPDNQGLREDRTYPANPDSEYGWEKLFSERLYFSMMRQMGIPVRIARFHNIFGTEEVWRGGREKAPTAICRKIAETTTGEIEIWGDGHQTRSFLYIDECLEGIRRLMNSDFTGPCNIGSIESISINNLVAMVALIANKKIIIKHISGPLGVRGRNSDNQLIKKKLGWEPILPLRLGMEKTYAWVYKQLFGEKL